MKTRSLLGSFLLFILSFVLVIGCGSSKGAAARVSGKVTYNGEPVTGGTVVFHSDAGVYPMAINPDGTYTMADLPEGEMTVTVDTEGLNPDKKKPVYVGGAGSMADKMRPNAPYGNPQAGAGGKNAASKAAIAAGAGKQKDSPIPEGANVNLGTYVKIPKNYSDKTKSPLKVAIKHGGQELNLELKD